MQQTGHLPKTKDTIGFATQTYLVQKTDNSTQHERTFADAETQDVYETKDSTAQTKWTEKNFYTFKQEELKIQITDTETATCQTDDVFFRGEYSQETRDVQTDPIDYPTAVVPENNNVHSPGLPREPASPLLTSKTVLPIKETARNTSVRSSSSESEKKLTMKFSNTKSSVETTDPQF